MVWLFITGPKLHILGFGPIWALWGLIYGAPWGPTICIGIVPLNFWWNFEWKNGMTLYCRTKNEHFRFGPHMGPLGAHMGPWEPGIGICIGPLNFWQNFEWKNGMPLYCRTNIEHVSFLGPIWALWGPIWGHKGPERALGCPWLKQARWCHSKKVCNIYVSQMVWCRQPITIIF